MVSPPGERLLNITSCLIVTHWPHGILKHDVIHKTGSAWRVVKFGKVCATHADRYVGVYRQTDRQTDRQTGTPHTSQIIITRLNTPLPYRKPNKDSFTPDLVWKKSHSNILASCITRFKWNWWQIWLVTSLHCERQLHSRRGKIGIGQKVGAQKLESFGL